MGRGAHKNNFLPTAISCQKVLIEIDQELNYGNHYRDLACLLACQGDIEGANQAFLDGLDHKNAKFTAGIHAEYAQFLLLNQDSEILNIDKLKITEYLYNVINSDNIGILEYEVTAQKTVCDILQKIIEEKNASVIINPKILAYYLLIDNPEYIKEGHNIIQDVLNYVDYNNEVKNDDLFLNILPHITMLGESQQINYSNEDSTISGESDPLP